MGVNRITQIVLVAGLLVRASPGLRAQTAVDSDTVRPVGTMVYLAGDVDVHRNGGLVDWTLVDIGLEIEDYDLVRTGRNGTAEIEMSTPATRDMIITVSEDTAFYFDVAKVGGVDRTSVEMLAGSVALKVRKLNENSLVQVRTQSVVMGVRGTEFTVTTAPDGSYLITAREGRVVCTDDSGIRKTAEAGRVVEKSADLFRSVEVPVSELDRYRDEWTAEKERIFRSNAPLFVRAFALQYRRIEPRFIEAVEQLLERRDVFDRWARAYAADEVIPFAELFAQRSQVTPAIVAVRSVLPVYEQLYYRLQTLERYHSQGVGRTTIERKLTSGEFFDEFRQNSGSIERGLSIVRYYLKLFARMSGFSESELLDEAFSDNPFGGSGPPKPTDPRSF